MEEELQHFISENDSFEFTTDEITITRKKVTNPKARVDGNLSSLKEKLFYKITKKVINPLNKKVVCLNINPPSKLKMAKSSLHIPNKFDVLVALEEFKNDYDGDHNSDDVKSAFELLSSAPELPMKASISHNIFETAADSSDQGQPMHQDYDPYNIFEVFAAKKRAEKIAVSKGSSLLVPPTAEESYDEDGGEKGKPDKKVKVEDDAQGYKAFCVKCNKICKGGEYYPSKKKSNQCKSSCCQKIVEFRCAWCPACYKNISSIRNHANDCENRPGAVKHSCPRCGYESFKLRDVRKHMSEVHKV